MGDVRTTHDFSSGNAINGILGYSVVKTTRNWFELSDRLFPIMKPVLSARRNAI